MTGADAIRTALNSTQFLATMLTNDLSDADLLVRPVPHANHIAWQLGHVLVSEARMIRAQLPDATYPDLPAGFAEKHTAETAGRDDGFFPKAVYLDTLNAVRAATLANLDKLSDADLSRPSTGNMAKMAPTVGAVFLLASNHLLMHVGQFSVIRRKLGKPVLF